MNALRFVDENNTASLHYLLTHSRYHKKNLYLEETDFYGNSPLLKACYLGKLNHVELLIQYGASLKAINYLGQNALTLATYSGDINIVRLLLKHRSYSDFNKSSIVPPVCVALLRQNKKLIEFFKRFPSTGQDVKTAHGVSPAQLSQWVFIYNRLPAGQSDKVRCSGAAYKMR